jgi:hypothetical protein
MQRRAAATTGDDGGDDDDGDGDGGETRGGDGGDGGGEASGGSLATTGEGEAADGGDNGSNEPLRLWKKSKNKSRSVRGWKAAKAERPVGGEPPWSVTATQNAVPMSTALPPRSQSNRLPARWRQKRTNTQERPSRCALRPLRAGPWPGCGDWT